ncbi:MAG: DUF2336 domain-containing protein [Alphaproteobacteria bacterium]|nr:MAG: DUF2336 domain-containing protein [Alphaproteobacteria bacterium]
MFERLLARLMGRLPRHVDYESARAILEDDSERAKRALAAHPETRPEMLYYLANAGGAEVRAHVAANPATPIQADELLVDDDDAIVRAELARKIARLVPGLSEDAQNQLRERAIALLEKLAADQLPKVRAIVAEEIKHSDRVPKHIVKRLARDVEAMVAAPILEYSPLLGDDDLREIIAAGAAQESLCAVARRHALSADTADAVAATLDVPAVTALLTNKSAQIREETLDAIIDHAQAVAPWHEPLTLRAELSIRAMKRIAGFVASALVARMVEDRRLDDDTAEDILDRARKRIDEEAVDQEDMSALASEAASLASAGAITDDFIRAAIKENRRGLVLHCLAAASGLSHDAVRRIMMAKSGRIVTALAWKAGLAMRTAFMLQRSVALVPPSQLLPARDGIDYPLDPEQLEWQLEAFVED